MNVRRPIALAAAASLSVLALAGCSNQAGVASQVGTQSITDRQVADLVAEVEAQNAKVAGSTFDEKATTANAVNFLTQKQLLDQAAAQAGVTVTQGDVDRVFTNAEKQLGTRQKVVDYVLSNFGLPASQLDAYFRASLEYSGIEAKAGAGATDDTAKQAAAEKYLSNFASSIGVDVSPRFGTWKGFGLGPVPNDLSFDPVAAASAAAASASATPAPTAS